jgi:hypothetical protein
MKLRFTFLSLIFSMIPVVTQAQSNNASEVAQQFFSALSSLNAIAATEFYADGHSDLFKDPVFGLEDSAHAKAIWKLLIASSLSYSQKTGVEPLRIDVAGIQTNSQDENQVRVYWNATYTYSETGRYVENHLTSDLTIENGKITRQRDSFDYCRWTEMALGGTKGWLACRFPILTHIQANIQLEKFIAATSGAPKSDTSTR